VVWCGVSVSMSINLPCDIAVSSPRYLHVTQGPSHFHTEALLGSF